MNKEHFLSKLSGLKTWFVEQGLGTSRGRFVLIVVCTVLVLFGVRRCHPEVAQVRPATDTPAPYAPTEKPEESAALATSENTAPLATPVPHALDFSYKHRIYSVPSYATTFPDLQDVQYPVARRGGVSVVRNRVEAEQRKGELLYVGANPYYTMDAGMTHSIPYLTPRASQLLQHIGRRFLDSLAVKQIPLHKIIVTSVLRTEDDVRRLRRVNGNASEQSCHRFGTTVDISYLRFQTVAPPGEYRREVRNDTLKFILSEVLRDCREQGFCYIKYERKQSCFHLTVR